MRRRSSSQYPDYYYCYYFTYSLTTPNCTLAHGRWTPQLATVRRRGNLVRLPTAKAEGKQNTSDFVWLSSWCTTKKNSHPAHVTVNGATVQPLRYTAVGATRTSSQSPTHTCWYQLTRTASNTPLRAPRRRSATGSRAHHIAIELLRRCSHWSSLQHSVAATTNIERLSSASSYSCVDATAFRRRRCIFTGCCCR
jgi:hypothetical protein